MGRRSSGEGTAPKMRKDGIWYRAIRIEGTDKRKYLYAKTKAELDKKYKEFAKQISSNTYVEAQKQTVEEYMKHWLTTYKKIELKPKSYDTLECTINNQIAPYFKGKQFFTITHYDVQNFINHMDTGGCSYSIIRKAYLALNACYKYAMIKNEIVKNPCFGVKLPKKATKDIKQIQTLTQQEIANDSPVCIYCGTEQGEQKTTGKQGVNMPLPVEHEEKEIDAKELTAEHRLGRVGNIISKIAIAFLVVGILLLIIALSLSGKSSTVAISITLAIIGGISK